MIGRHLTAVPAESSCLTSNPPGRGGEGRHGAPDDAGPAQERLFQAGAIPKLMAVVRKSDRADVLTAAGQLINALLGPG